MAATARQLSIRASSAGSSVRAMYSNSAAPVSLVRSVSWRLIASAGAAAAMRRALEEALLHPGAEGDRSRRQRRLLERAQLGGPQELDMGRSDAHRRPLRRSKLHRRAGQQLVAAFAEAGRESRVSS